MSGHLVIAGTGRAGTTFLVQWLGVSGLSVGVFGDDDYDDTCRAGLERRFTGHPTLPYVVKDPWFSTYCTTVDPGLVEALIVPVRPIEQAAASRVRQERAAIQQSHPGWPSDIFGRVPGGMIHHIDVDAQARTLALEFHRLIEWAVANDVPLVLLDFPRIIHDADYLLAKLGGWLPNLGDAQVAHRAVARPEMVTVTVR